MAMPGLGPEQRAENRCHRPLIEQLAAAAYEAPARTTDTNTGGSSNSKPSSRMPGNLQQPDEIMSKLTDVAYAYSKAWLGGAHSDVTANLRALAAASQDDDEARELAADLRPIVRRARILIGYQHQQQHFTDMVCDCGGALAVDRSIDSGTVVRCAGAPGTGPCKITFPWWTWADMLKALTGSRADA
ncbi:hypothetical protein ACFV1L_13415 [Kitasatospora sp. NPDC059646]|uniref:hypothetical protein n=1 Tax=Kitasatospora sp. NPDC059646 TaxID=3346893 RepID=UPI003685493F